LVRKAVRAAPRRGLAADLLRPTSPHRFSLGGAPLG
jgi:hypothetical protein